MKREEKIKTIDLKTYIIPLITIAILFAITRSHISQVIHRFIYNQMAEDANRQAESHMARLSTSMNAKKIIDGLIEERLVTAANAVAKNSDRISNQVLEEMAQDLKVDKIYWFNGDGELIYTADDFQGWSVGDKGSIHKFIKGRKDLEIEPVRLDRETGQYIKYISFKTGYGDFVQIGILAENINKLTDVFCTQSFFDNLAEREEINQIYFLNNEDKLVNCAGDLESGSYNLDWEEKRAIEDNRKYYTRKTINTIPVYETLLPVYVDDLKVGTMIIIYSLEGADLLVKKMSSMALLLLFLVFLVYGLMAINVIIKNHRIEEIAYYDPVTKLLNKDYFKIFMERELEFNLGTDKALLIVKSSNLNLVKLIFGQEILDNILIEEANTIKGLYPRDKNTFRYAEDSFCIFVDRYRGREDLIRRSEEILLRIDDSIARLDNGDLINNRLGIIEIRDNYKDLTRLYKHIEVIISKIDKLEDKKYDFFDEEMQEELIEEEIMEKELRRGSLNSYDEFYLLYQPQLDLKTKKIVGLEALSRWKNRELGYVSPYRFIEMAEKTQLITHLGEWVIKSACDFLKILDDLGMGHIKMSINISVIQLLEEDFVDSFLKIVSKTGINIKNLVLEITETSLMNNFELINWKLNLLRKEGVTISLDDFGTGYASLSRLNNLNIDELKIDKSFIDNIVNSEKEDIFVNSILVLAKELGLRTVAEGVEREEQKEYLKKRDCDLMQGYFFSKPLFGEEIIELLNLEAGEEFSYGEDLTLGKIVDL